MIVNWAGIIAASHWVPYTCVVADPKPQRHQEEYQNAEVNQGLQERAALSGNQEH